MPRQPRIISKGTCALCKSAFSKSAMTRHLLSCIEKTQIDEKIMNNSSPLIKFFHLLVEGHHLPEYRMHLKVSSHARFEDLDNFLREIWLECCGHMSAFRLEEKR
jgi:hypothetical protein